MTLRGTLYVGYPIVVLGGVARRIDALLTCREYGVVVFRIWPGAGRLPPDQTLSHANEIRQSISIALVRAGHLLVGNRTILGVRVVILDPEYIPSVAPTTAATETEGSSHHGYQRPRYSTRPPLSPRTGEDPSSALRDSEATHLCGWATLDQVLRSTEPVDAATLRYVDAAVQRLNNLRVRRTARLGELAGERARVLAEIDARIATLDQWQKAAAIEMPDGPQRIRGLAGTGKTVVLAWKAAYLHASEPTWTIALTFYARTLYEPLRAMVERFHRDHTGRAPDWTRLRIQHAWGARGRPGIYSDVANHLGLRPKSIAEAAPYEPRRFEGVCREVLNTMGPGDPAPLYDAILVDEAQDMPAAFLEMVYRVTAPPRRVVWAYDDLQDLDQYQPAPPAVLFGQHPDGRPRVLDLGHNEGDARADVILPICYRNTPWALTVAHALGLGVYRTPPVGNRAVGLLQFYDDPKLWSEIGYEVTAGNFISGEQVALARGAFSTPEFFDELLDSHDALTCRVFQSHGEEIDWVAGEIALNLGEDGLDPRDILVVSANPYFSRASATPLIQAIWRHAGARAHCAEGQRDELFGDDDSVPIANIRHAKGHEAPMVYVIHADQAAVLDNPVRRRNTLFTAITRSRAWVRITGSGPLMHVIEGEVREVVEHGFALELRVPLPAEQARMRRLRRDVTAPRRNRSTRRAR